MKRRINDRKSMEVRGMNEEINNINTDLKNLFVESKLQEIVDILKEQSDEVVKELSDHNWGIVKKYYDTENFSLLFRYMKFVAYSCFLVEYAYKRNLIREEAFSIMISIYNDIYELIREQKS